MPKIFLIVAAIFCVGSVALGFMTKGKLDDARDTIRAKDTEIVDQKERIAAEEKKAQEQEAAKVAALAELETTREDLSKTAQELGAEKSKVDTLTQQISSKEAEITAAKEQISQLQAAVDAATGSGTGPDGTTAIASVTAELETVKQQVEIAEQEKRLLAEKLEAAQNQMTALRRDAERRAAGLMARGLQGQVLAVNQAWGFVILSLGDRQGVAANAEMLVRRGDSLIGKVKISTVEPTTSVADIIPGSMQKGLRIQPGDTVIYSEGSFRQSADSAAPLPQS